MKKPIQITLPNGLSVVLLENHTAPVVSLNLWANVGSVNETDQEAGLCHLIEHMLFKGTSRRPVGQIAGEVEGAGGDMNAYTSFDETVFYINMSSKKWPLGVDILADAATDPTFDQEELTREKEVVIEEMARSEDNPHQMVGQDLFTQVFKQHPYGRPIIGDRNTVRTVSREHLMQFYRKWYVGPNLIFIATGDFDSAKMIEEVTRLFSKIPNQQPPTQNILPEPPATALTFQSRGMSVQGRHLEVGFQIPHFTHPDVPALDILAQILGGGASSRLERVVKEDKHLVTSISASPYTPRYPGIFVVGATLQGKELRETMTAIRNQIDLLKEQPPTTLELSRARDNLRSTRVYGKQTVESLARKLGYFVGIAESLDFEEDYYHKVSEVTPEDIQRVASQYLKHDGMSVAFVHPLNEKWTADQVMAGPAKTSPKRATKKPPQDGVHFFKLKSGVRLLVKENSNLPLVSMRSASLGGLRSETSKNNGISHLLSLLITKGTHTRTSREIAELTENLNGHIDSYAGRNLFGMSGTFLAEKQSEGFDLFFDMLCNPSLPQDEIDMEKARTYTALRNEEDSLSRLVMKNFLKQLYPRHPYGMSMLGKKESVKKISQKDLFRFHQSIIHPKNLVISVVGDISSEEIRERFEERLSLWKAPSGRLVKIALPKAPSRPLVITEKKKKMQAHIAYGFLGTTLRHPDRYPLEVMSSVLSGQGGRLFIELRDKQGLAYTVSSSTNEGIEPGYIMVYMGTDPVKFDQALGGIYKELEKIRSQVVGEDELERAKRFIIGNYELGLQKNDSVAGLLAFDEIYGLGRNELSLFPERIEKVTREDILRVAKKYLRPQNSVLSVIKT